ncbi:hypothetical protein Mgra_00008348 [Meloidogyne graminicola]|uniref:Uncharacterized protein n=1 Tax=Meloidogyne graminicola TaxID=189291 RepID=A0A8S9ZG37_9BILA|nr:hypothetical protein Mgra_00008348 [Meloidogyne graminicola]
MLFYRKYEGKRRGIKIGEENEEEIKEKLKLATKQIEIFWATEQKALSGESTKFENPQNYIKSPFEHKLPEHYFWPRTNFNLNKKKENLKEKKNNWYDKIPDGYMFNI